MNTLNGVAGYRFRARVRLIAEPMLQRIGNTSCVLFWESVVLTSDNFTLFHRAAALRAFRVRPSFGCEILLRKRGMAIEISLRPHRIRASGPSELAAWDMAHEGNASE